MDDVDILRELLRSIHLTGRQKDALGRVLSSVSRRVKKPAATSVTAPGTPVLVPRLRQTCRCGLPCPRPLLGPRDPE